MSRPIKKASRTHESSKTSRSQALVFQHSSPHFLSVFFGCRIPNFINGLSEWWTPNQSLRTQETVTDRCQPNWSSNSIQRIDTFVFRPGSCSKTGHENPKPDVTQNQTWHYFTMTDPPWVTTVYIVCGLACILRLQSNLVFWGKERQKTKSRKLMGEIRQARAKCWRCWSQGCIFCLDFFVEFIRVTLTTIK